MAFLGLTNLLVVFLVTTLLGLDIRFVHGKSSKIAGPVSWHTRRNVLHKTRISISTGIMNAYRKGSTAWFFDTLTARKRLTFLSCGRLLTCGCGLPPSRAIVFMARGGQVKTERPRSNSKTSSSTKRETKRKKSSDHRCPLSDPQPFIPVERIALLTLGDLGALFQYAATSTVEGFDKQQFLSEKSLHVQSMVNELEKAASSSRGEHAKIVKIDPDSERKPGSIDAFNFCAAMRILAEWRLLRLVPSGHSRFASSMKMGHKDVVQNIKKIEHSAHEYEDYQKEAQGVTQLCSPTLRQLLQYEREMGLHPALPKLKEVSGGMGLLWVRRQLHFQLAFFENALDKSFTTSSGAFQAAYARVYSSFHGMAVKKIFNYSLQGAPEMQEVYVCMQPAIKDGGEAPDQEEGSNVKQEAHANMKAFLEVTLPILSDVEELFNEFNMNDPKKV